MALNFPSSPTNGQQYQNWIYDSAKGAWEAKPLEAMAATPSPTAPLAPQSGDMWYNTNDGGVYLYYNDGNTSQWVQMKSDATLSSTLGERTTTLENKLGLSRIIPPTVNFSGGSATANSLGTVSFTGVTSISLNDIFSSTYSSYRVLISKLICNTASTPVKIRLRASGSDYTGNQHYTQGVQAVGLNSPTSYSATNNSYVEIGHPPTTASYYSASFDIHNPTGSVAVPIFGQSYGFSTSVAAYSYGLLIDAGSARTGITIFTGSTATYTGQIQVFGYNS